MVAASLLLAGMPALALPTPSPPFVARAPIDISSNADFTAANGVVAGTGSPADPFVIAGWSITASGGIGIRIHNVTANFTVRDNMLAARTGVSITQTAVIGLVQNNKFVTMGTGVYVAYADAIVVDNSFVGDITLGNGNKGVVLLNSNSRVESNAFVYTPYGIVAERGSPQILCNDIHDDTVLAAIQVKFTTNATIGCNIITSCQKAIASINAIGTVIVNNTINTCAAGLEIILTKDAEIRNNSIRFIAGVGVSLWHASGNFTGNVVVDGKLDAVVMEDAPMVVANNTIENNLRVGFWLKNTAADVRANVVSRNSVGIFLDAGSVPNMTANVFTNNTVGVDLPYGSRQAIVRMEANLVNGVNIDGAINASQRVYFYKAANVSITGQVRDSGFGAGYYGSITAQGGVVLYEVDTATINATLVSHHNVGISAVNSFNVQVEASVLLSNLVGIRAEVVNVGLQVPNCVVSVKDTNVTIPVDPIATVGIDVRGSCLALVARTNVSVVDTGIRVVGSAGLTLTNSTVAQTKLALDVEGSPNMVQLHGNLLVDNRGGARLSGTAGAVVANNTFRANADFGLQLLNGARITLAGNNFTANGVGLQDVEACLGPLSCSSVTARQNVFLENAGDGATVRGASSWRGDAFLGNGGSGVVLESAATLDAIVAAGNERDGARLFGKVEVDASAFTRNGEDGLELHGGGELRGSAFTHNEDAGIRLSATYVRVQGSNVSHNFDGILADEVTSGIPWPSLPETISVPGLLQWATTGTAGADAFDVHRTKLMGNERDAIRAGAAIVNATHNYYGRPQGPSISVGDQVGAFSNGVSPAVRFVPWYEDEAMTTTAPIYLL